MTVSSFARARRSRLPVMTAETERAMDDNAARWAAHHARDAKHRRRPDANQTVAPEMEPQVDYDKRLYDLEAEAGAAIGRKTLEGIRMAEAGGIPDLPLRQDHAAEITGRAPKTSHEEALTPLERLAERVPTEETAAERMAEFTDVRGPGPTPEMVKEAAVETAPLEEKENVAKQFDRQIEDAKRQEADVADRRAAREAQVAEPAADEKTPQEISKEAVAGGLGKEGEKIEQMTRDTAEASKEMLDKADPRGTPAVQEESTPEKDAEKAEANVERREADASTATPAAVANAAEVTKKQAEAGLPAAGGPQGGNQPAPAGEGGAKKTTT